MKDYDYDISYKATLATNPGWEYMELEIIDLQDGSCIIDAFDIEKLEGYISTLTEKLNDMKKVKAGTFVEELRK